MAQSPKLTLMETTSTTEKKTATVSARFSFKVDNLDLAHDLVGKLNTFIQDQVGEHEWEDGTDAGEVEITSFTVEINGITYS